MMGLEFVSGKQAMAENSDMLQILLTKPRVWTAN